MDTREILDALSEPFPATDIEWRAGSTNREKTSAMALAYVTARAVMSRLDKVLGPENWKDTYVPGPNGGVMCMLSVRFGDEWITKTGLAENTQFEAVKGGESGALKRAAVKFGIGRYLYKLPTQWVAAEQKGKTVVLKEKPRLPAWALPEPGTRGREATAARKAVPVTAAPKAKAKPAPAPVTTAPMDDEIEDLDAPQEQNPKQEQQAPKRKVEEETLVPHDHGDYVIRIGTRNRGKKLSEISRKMLRWYADNLDKGSPKSADLRKKAGEYLLYLEQQQPA